MTTFIYVVIVGGLAGWLASIVMGTSARMGCLLNVVVGIIGGVIGNWLFMEMGWLPPQGNFLGPLVVAFVGAVLFLGVLRLITRR